MGKTSSQRLHNGPGRVHAPDSPSLVAEDTDPTLYDMPTESADVEMEDAEEDASEDDE